MKDYHNTQNATIMLLSARQSVKAAKEREQNARKVFAETILMDAIENPSRVLRLDPYWRLTELLPMDVECMVVKALEETDNPDFAALKTMHTSITRRFAEFDEDGKPTGTCVEKTEDVPVIVNLGAVKPPKDGEPEEAVLGSAPLVDTVPLCEKDSCYHLRRGQRCPYETTPHVKWKCANNHYATRDLINKVLEAAGPNHAKAK